jgi:4-hydroxy-tetrahydrodipicolinate synthase
MADPRGQLLPGSYTPLVTPFRDGRVDFDAFDALVELQLEGGSRGVVVCGTTGEPTSLTLGERAALYMHAAAVAEGRMAVIAATGAPDQATTFKLTDTAAKSGVDAVLVVSPAFIKPSQQGLVEHFSAVAARVELPMLLYNIPGRSAVSIEPSTIATIVERSPNVIGVKHASTDLDFITELLLGLGDDFHVFCGTESLSYPMLALGASGLMSAVGNLLPRRIAGLCEAAHAGDHETALREHRSLFAVNRAVFFETNPVPLKRMLAEYGICSEEVRPPLAPLDASTRDRVLDALRAYEPETSSRLDVEHPTVTASAAAQQP